jgi:uncharacterized protein
LAHPDRLRGPLDCGVTVIAAHSGTSLSSAQLKTFLGLLPRYPRLYGDNSGMNNALRARFFRALLAPEVQARLVHGSDLPIPVSGLWAALALAVDWRTYRECRRIENPLEREFRLKQALGFRPETFTRLYDLMQG